MGRNIHITTGASGLLLPDGHARLVEALGLLLHAVLLVVGVLGGVGPGLHGAVGVHQNGLRRQGWDRFRRRVSTRTFIQKLTSFQWVEPVCEAPPTSNSPRTFCQDQRGLLQQAPPSDGGRSG